MELERAACLIAMQSKDDRFDGKFFIGVTTTGIYCRTVCPVPCPKPENVVFYRTAAEASEAGLRPCLRCRPESAPGTDEWRGSASMVGRALRLIDQGYLDQASLDELAGALNIGTRHLRRLFIEEVGSSPTAVAKTRRLHFAKKLVDETRLPFGEVAYSAGFSSIRRFNAVMQKTYGRTPSALRGKQAGNGKHADAVRLRLKLSYRPPLDWESTLKYLKARAIKGVEAVEADDYERVANFGNKIGLINVSHQAEKNHLILQNSSNLSGYVMQIVERTRRLFDLSADPKAISGTLGGDQLLGRAVINNPGMRIPGAWDKFELIVRAILGQQVSLKAANTLAHRLAIAFGDAFPDSPNPRLTQTFPRPDQIADANLSELGITKQRAAAIKAAAKLFVEDEAFREPMVSNEEAIERLREIRGVGEWTVQYVAMRAFGDPNAFPAGDLWLQKKFRQQNGSNGDRGQTGNKHVERELLSYAQAWQPWRGYAAMHLWRLTEDDERDQTG